MSDQITPKDRELNEVEKAQLKTTRDIRRRLESLRTDAMNKPIEGKNQGRITAINDCINQINIAQYDIYYPAEA